MGERVRFVVPGDYPRQVQGSPQLARLAPHGEVIVHTDRPSDGAEQLRRAAGARVILNSRLAVRWPGELLRQLPDLRLICAFAVGTDNLDLAAARELGITVCNVPGRTAPMVAEHTLALMLGVAKRLVWQTAELRAGRWGGPDNVYLAGKTLGVIGTGNIGSHVATLGRAIGMRVLAWTHHPAPERAVRLGVEYGALDDLLRQSDVVTLHLRLTDASRGTLGARELALMKPGAILVNAGRGPLVDEDALVTALESGHLAGAGLDVYATEPLPADAPLLRCQNMVLTPHNADTTPEGVEAVNTGAIDNALAWLEGRPQNVVAGPGEATEQR